MLMKFLRSLAGTAVFSAEGNCPERVLAGMEKEGILIVRASCQDDRITAEIAARNYRRLRPIARKTGCRIRLVRRKGIGFRLRRYRKRAAGWLVCLLAFAAVTGYLSRFIWSVRVVGNESLPDEKILGVFSELGVTPGRLGKELDYRILREQAMLSLGDLSWIGFQRKGSNLTIQVKEKSEKPDVIGTELCDIVAAKDAVIKRIEVYRGSGMRKAGEAVRRGDILVSGTVCDKEGKTVGYVHADAVAVGEVPYEKVIEIPLDVTERIYCGTPRTNIVLRLFSVRAELGFRPRTPLSEVREDVKHFALSGHELPLSVGWRTYAPYTEEKRRISREEAREKALAELKTYEKQIGKICIIRERIMRDEWESEKYRLIVNYKCEENIGIMSEFSQDKEK